LFDNDLLNQAYLFLKEEHPKEANYMLKNSYVILSNKKIELNNELTEQDIKKINNYKYPERLYSFVKTSSQKYKSWDKFSFRQFI